MADDDPKDSSVITELRSQLKAEQQAREAQAGEIRELRTARLLDDAKIPTDGAGAFLRSNFSKVYSGDLTVEAVKKYAEDNGIVSQVHTTPPAERDFHHQMQEASLGARPFGDVKVDQAQMDALMATKTVEELDALAAKLGILGID